METLFAHNLMEQQQKCSGRQRSSSVPTMCNNEMVSQEKMMSWKNAAFLMKLCMYFINCPICRLNISYNTLTEKLPT